MVLKRVATFKAGKQEKAIVLRMDDEELQISHTQLAAYRYYPGIVAELRAQAREHSLALMSVFVHVNRDGSLALATGMKPVCGWSEGMIMVRSVEEINITNWTATGSSVSIPQYQFDLEIKWTDNDGNPRIHNGIYRYPNDISSMPLNVRRRYAEDMVIAAARVALGINEWNDYRGLSG